jgi:hypothetical protein
MSTNPRVPGRMGENSMKNSNRFAQVLGTALGIALLAQFASTPALAALGGDATSVEADRVKMKGELRVTSASGYAVHEIQTPSGTVVREYVSPNGKVFAVSWRGPTLPDLRQTLGTYFEQYKAAAAGPHPSHNHLAVEQPGLVVHSTGHMRAYFGQAYVPGLLPQNFSVDDIK